MAACSQVSHNKRGRDEYWNSVLAFPDSKRTNSAGTLAHDSDLLAFLDKIDNMDDSKETQVEGEIRLNGIIKSLGDEIGLKVVQTDKESGDENGSTDQIGSNKQGALTADGISEATSVTFNIGDMTYYDGFFVDHITADEFGFIMQNYLAGDSVPNITYSGAVHSYIESREVSYIGPLWEDDIWQFNENPVIQNDFASPQQEEFGIAGAEFQDVWNY